MTLWVVIGLLAVLLSPLAWLVPSRRQQGQMAMRMAARGMGLAMQLARQEWPHWLPEEPPNPCPQYHRARRAGQRDSWCYWQVAPGQWVNQWREPCVDTRLIEYLQALPADVYKVGGGPRMLARGGGERGDAQALQPVAALLKALA